MLSLRTLAPALFIATLAVTSISSFPVERHREAIAAVPVMWPHCPGGRGTRPSLLPAPAFDAPLLVAPNCGAGCQPRPVRSGTRYETPMADEPLLLAPNCASCRPRPSNFIPDGDGPFLPAFTA